MCRPPEPLREDGRFELHTPPMPHEITECDVICIYHDHTPCIREAYREVGRKWAEREAEVVADAILSSLS